MSLTNIQYERIRRQYDDDRLDAEKELERRIRYVNESVPGFKELSDEIAMLGLEHTKRALRGDKSAVSELSSHILSLTHKKEALLTSAGLDKDYLKIPYKCPDCRDTGFIGSKKCHCFVAKEISLLYDQSNIRASLNNISFDMMSERYYSGEDLTRFRESVQKAMAFVKNFNSDYQNLLLYGTVGTGKSMLSSCVAKELLDKGHSVIYFSSSSLIDELAKATFDKGYGRSDRDTSVKLGDELIYDSELLIIDDLGTEITNNFTIAALFSLLNERSLRRRSVIISTNLSLEEIQERYTDRIFSRLTGDFTFCRLSGPDIRIAHKFAD